MSSKLELFLEKVKESFPESEPKVSWQLASYQISEEFCSIRLLQSSGGICGLPKKDGKCPYHFRKDHDFWRKCDFIDSNEIQCNRLLKTRDLSVVWCVYHLNTPKSNILLRRVGEYIVIKDTPYALSDDMLSIIGRVETNYQLQFVLRRERDQLMSDIAKNYGLMIRMEES